MFSKLAILATRVFITLAAATIFPPFTPPGTFLCCDSVVPCPDTGPVISPNSNAAAAVIAELDRDLTNCMSNIGLGCSLITVIPGTWYILSPLHSSLHDRLTDHSSNSDRIAVECEKWDNVRAIGINCVNTTL
ncbi:hypothetical protein B0H13DRAFT_2456829 [Mycena leptocephala]|nr:hypothetical protein B0H13DRAFT_2456829 [Mycena leptocephala]